MDHRFRNGPSLRTSSRRCGPSTGSRQTTGITPGGVCIRSPENKHTDADIPEYVPAVGLEAVGRAYAKIIDEVNTLDLKALSTAAAVTSLAGGR
jgi:hypothetical protein